VAGLSLEEREVLRSDFRVYASSCLKIVTKGGGVEPFKLNQAQEYVNSRLEQQMREKGCVRALVLKGRQQGISTYTEGRFYWKVTHREGVTAFVLSHKSDTTDMLFNMTRRYHENVPEMVRPHTSQESAKALYFDKLDSKFSIGTAGGKETGRGGTIQYFHGSECAFWENAEQHMAGLFQAVPSGEFARGTEIILESTANGPAGPFFQLWQEAEKGEGEYIAIFIPWFWQNEYRITPPAGWVAEGDLGDYQRQFKLDDAQIYWMDRKVRELGNRKLFDQEYPATSAHAFVANSENVLIDPSAVMAARKRVLAPHEIYGPIVAGGDVARFGDDRGSLVARRGNQVIAVRSFSKIDTMQFVGEVINFIQEFNVAKMFIDETGLGAGVVDRLAELGYKRDGTVIGVNFGQSPIAMDRFSNKRAEMWWLMKEWIESGKVQIPDKDGLHFDLVAPLYSYDSSGRVRIERKEDMKKRGVRSPDEADALALTFAFPVPNSELGMYSGNYIASDAGLSYDELNF